MDLANFALSQVVNEYKLKTINKLNSTQQTLKILSTIMPKSKIGEKISISFFINNENTKQYQEINLFSSKFKYRKL